MLDPGYLERTFQKVCDWSSFNLDQDDKNWNWNTFICTFYPCVRVCLFVCFFVCVCVYLSVWFNSVGS